MAHGKNFTTHQKKGYDIILKGRTHFLLGFHDCGGRSEYIIWTSKNGWIVGCPHPMKVLVKLWSKDVRLDENWGWMEIKKMLTKLQPIYRLQNKWSALGKRGRPLKVRVTGSRLRTIIRVGTVSIMSLIAGNSDHKHHQHSSRLFNYWHAYSPG